MTDKEIFEIWMRDKGLWETFLNLNRKDRERNKDHIPFEDMHENDPYIGMAFWWYQTEDDRFWFRLSDEWKKLDKKDYLLKRAFNKLVEDK